MVLSYPSLGKHIIFDGSLLHGAPSNETLKKAWTAKEPGNLSSSSSDNNDDVVRVTFLVNIWINSRPSIHSLDDEIKGRVGYEGEGLGSIGFCKREFATVKVDEGHVAELDPEERIRLHFVSSGSTWDDNADDAGDGDNEEDGEEEEMEGLVIEMLPPSEVLSETTKFVFTSSEAAPALVYVGDEYDDVDEA